MRRVFEITSPGRFSGGRLVRQRGTVTIDAANDDDLKVKKKYIERVGFPGTRIGKDVTDQYPEVA